MYDKCICSCSARYWYWLWEHETSNNVGIMTNGHNKQDGYSNVNTSVFSGDRGICAGNIDLWHSVLWNISICAMWEASVQLLTACGGCLNITMVLFQQFKNTLIIRTHCQRAIVIHLNTCSHPVFCWKHREEKVLQECNEWDRRCSQTADI